MLPGSVCIGESPSVRICDCHTFAEAKSMPMSETYRGNFSGLRNILKDRVLLFRGLVWRNFYLNVIHLPFCFSMDPAQMSCND